MTTRRKRNPAHTVLLRELGERAIALEGMEGTQEFLFNLGAVSALLEVLREMLIPEEAQEKVLAELLRIANRWGEVGIGTVGNNQPKDLHRILSRRYRRRK